MYDLYEPLKQILFCLNVNNSLEPDRLDDKIIKEQYILKIILLCIFTILNGILCRQTGHRSDHMYRLGMCHTFGENR